MIDGNAGSECTYTIANWANTTLPIMLIDFTGENNGNYNELHWRTEQENNSGYFILEKSYDGNYFTYLARVEAAGSSIQPLDYNFTDENVTNGITYYKLNMYDKNGTFIKFQTAVVKSPGYIEFNLKPNPATDILTLSGNKNSFSFICDPPKFSL